MDKDIITIVVLGAIAMGIGLFGLLALQLGMASVVLLLAVVYPLTQLAYHLTRFIVAGYRDEPELATPVEAIVKGEKP